LIKEIDLFDPSAILPLRMEVLIGDFSVSQGAIKSMMNRIELIERNCPATGRLPTGRTFDKITETWGIDKAVQKRVRMAAKLYLKGERWPKIADITGWNQSHLYHIFRYDCGDRIKASINSKKYNIHWEGELRIPRLLPQKTIDLIRDKSEQSRSYEIDGKPKKYKFLFSQVLKCRKCGYAAYGFPVRERWLYYQHVRNSANLKVNNCDGFKYIPAGKLEDAIMTDIFSMIDTKEKMEEAIRKATPLETDKGMLQEELSLLKTRLRSLKNKKTKLVRSIADGLSMREAKPILDEIRTAEAQVELAIADKKVEIDNVLSKRELVEVSKKLKDRLLRSYFSTGVDLTFENKRDLILTLFGGKGNGIFIEKIGDKVEYELKGKFINKKSSLALESKILSSHGPLSQHREHAGMFRTGTDGLSVPPQQPEKAAQVHVGDDRDAHFSGRRQHVGPKQTRKNLHPGGKNPGTVGI